MKRNKILFQSVGIIFLLLVCSSVTAQTSLKYKTLCKTWLYESIEAKIGFPLDTTIINFQDHGKLTLPVFQR